MLLTLSDIISQLDKTLKTDSTAYPLADKVLDVNLAQSRAKFLESQAAGTWQADDPNHTKQSIIMLDLVSGQRDYSFRTDQEGAEIQEIFKAFVADPNYVFNELELRDSQSEDSLDMTPFTDGRDTTGTPTKCELSGNTLNFDLVPNYSFRLANELKQGIKLYVNRDDTFFLTSDTSKVPGLLGLFHEYLVLRPALRYAERNGMDIAGSLRLDVAEMESAITQYYASRKRVGRNRLTAKPINPF